MIDAPAAAGCVGQSATVRGGLPVAAEREVGHGLAWAIARHSGMKKAKNQARAAINMRVMG